MKTPERFMVVDDDTTSNMLCKYSLLRSFTEVNIELYADPEKALKIIKEENSKVNISTILLLDINMPTMTGWDFLNVFKDYSDDIHKRFTIYILSSSVDRRDKEKAEINEFVSGFLSKPFLADNFKEEFINNSGGDVKG